MEDKIKILQDAIGTGEVVKIRYHGGSQPGTVREIVPKKIDSEYLEAYCVSRSENRTFRIDKIKIASEDEEITFDKDFKGVEKNFKVKCSVCNKTYIVSKVFLDEINAKKFEEWLYSQDEHHCRECFINLKDYESEEIISKILDDKRIEEKFLKTFKKNPIKSDLSNLSLEDLQSRLFQILEKSRYDTYNMRRLPLKELLESVSKEAGIPSEIIDSPITLQELEGNAISSSILNNKKLETDIRNSMKKKYPDFSNHIIASADLYDRFKKYFNKYGYDINSLRWDYFQKLVEIILERIINKLGQQSLKEPTKETPKKAEPVQPEIISPKKSLSKFVKTIFIIIIIILSLAILLFFIVVCQAIAESNYGVAIVGIIFTSPFAFANYKLIKKLK
jgi:hypothetical protein